MKSKIALYAAFTILALAGCDSPEEKLDKYLSRGNEYFAEKDYVKARLEYKNAARINPADAEIIYKLGLVEEAQGNIQAALSAFLTAEQQDPEFMPVVQKLAEFFLTAQQDQEAMARIHKMLAHDKANPLAHALHASVLLKRGNLGAAEEAAATALSLDADNVIGHSVRAGIYNARQQTEKAIETLDQAAERNPDEISYLLLKGMILADAGRIDEVSAVYYRVFNLRPNDIKFRLDLANIMAAAGRPAQAEEVLRSTVAKFPDNKAVKRKLVELIENNGGLTAAEGQIKSFYEKSEGDQEFNLWLAELYLRNKKNDLAVAALKNVLSVTNSDRVDLTANTALARITLSEGNLETAENIINSVLEQNVNDADALVLRANLAYRKGDIEHALADLRTVLQDNPSNAQAAWLLTELFVLQGQVRLAIDTLADYGEHAPDDMGAQVRLSQIYLLDDNAPQARKILDYLGENHPDYAPAWETLARLSIAEKQFASAEKALSRLRDIEGNEPVAKLLEGQIAAAKGEAETATGIYKDVIVSYSGTSVADHALSALLPLSRETGSMAELEDFLRLQAEHSAAVTTALGGIQETLGKRDEAAKTFRAAIAMKPRDPAPYLSLAQLLKAQGDSDGAIAVLEQAGQALPGEAKPKIMRADMLINTGDVDSGIAVYRDLLAHSKGAPHEDTVANNLAQAVADYKSGDTAAMEEARIAAERFINSDNPYFLDTLGWIYFRQGNAAQAEPILQKAVSLLATPNPQVDYHYGALLHALGRNEEARKYLERALKSGAFEGDEDARDLIGRL